MKGHPGQHTPPTLSSKLRLQGRTVTSVTYTPVSGRAGTPVCPGSEAHRGPPACELPCHCERPSGVEQRCSAAGFSNGTLCWEMAVTGAVPSLKAVPRRVGSDGQEGLHGPLHLLPGHLRRLGTGSLPCEAVPGPLCSICRYQAFLIAYFQSWQSRPDPNVANGLPDMEPTQMAPSPSAACGSLDSTTRGGPLTPAGGPLVQESPTTM